MLGECCVHIESGAASKPGGVVRLVLVSLNYRNKIRCVTPSCAVHRVRVGSETRDGQPQHDMDGKPPGNSTAVDPIESEFKTQRFKAIMSLRSLAGQASRPL